MKFVRTEAALLAIAITLSFLSGLLILFVQKTPAEGITAPILSSELQRFENSTQPVLTFKPQSLAEFINPAHELPFYFKFDFNEVQALRKFSETCKAQGRRPTNKDLLKAWDWQSYACANRQPPDSFATSAPYFHPSGRSYAYLAKRESSWVQTHQKFFHVMELKELGATNLEPPLDHLSQLSWTALHRLAQNDEVVMSDRWIFLKRSAEGISYKIYPQETWSRFWDRTPIRPLPLQLQTSSTCFVKQGAVCWTYDVKQAYFSGWNPLLALLAISLVLTVSLFGLLTVRIRRRQKEEERLKFALEMLTHELRTPLTNLTLNVDQMRSDFDVLPENSQIISLRIFDQVERLRRVADASQSYLAKDLRASLLAPRYCEIPSLTNFIQYCLEPFLPQIELQVDDDGTALRTDPYWTSVCIKNLVENAIKHGVKPVRVRVQKRASQWKIEIQDQGMAFFDPENARKNARRSDQSNGLGLGLKLTRRILPFLKGEMTLQFQPTRLQIHFKEIP